MRTLTPLLAFLTLGLLATHASATVIFNDAFNDNSLTTNTGPGAVGPAQAWVVQAGGFPGHTPAITEANGATTVTSNPDTTPYAIAQVVGRVRQSYDVFDATPTRFAYTLRDMTVTRANTDARPDVPGAGLGAIRYELGIVSNDDKAEAVDELYRTTAGGFFVSVWKDAAGNLTGNLRETNETHTQDSDAEGTTGQRTLATFALAGNGTSPFGVNIDLGAGGYAVTFDQAVVVTSGALSGGFGTRADGTTPFLSAANFATGAFETASVQNWGTGYGSAAIDNVSVSVAPEPTTLAAIVAGATIAMRRRRVR